MNPEAQKIWNRTIEIIKSQISAGNYRTWFSQTEIGDLEGNTLIIIVSSAFIKGQLSNRYEPLIKSAAEQVIGSPVEIRYEIDASRIQKKGKAPIQETEEEELFELSTPEAKTAVTNLNPKYTLKNFVVGLTNNLAYAAAQAVVQNPGVSYNPLFIYGPSGVGKTHLMQAIGNELTSKNGYTKLIYASSERFMNDFVDSIQNKRMGAFRSKYRSCDILLIDDIQFISGKDSMQEEFFHTFNELQGKNAQIVLTSDRVPNEIQKLENRLASRFQGGLMVDVQLPDFDTRVAILRAKLAEKHETLPDECITYIAETFPSNTRELEGKLISILQMVKLMNLEPSIETIQRFLGNPQPVKQTPLW